MIPDTDLAFTLGQAKIHACSAMIVMPDGRLHVRHLIYSPAEFRSDEIMGRGWTEYPHRLTLEEVWVEGSALINISSQMHRGDPPRSVPKEYHYCWRCERLKKDGKEIPYARQHSCYRYPTRKSKGPPRPPATYFQCDACTAKQEADEKAAAERWAKEPAYDIGAVAVPVTRVTRVTSQRFRKHEFARMQPMPTPKLSEDLFPVAKKGDFFDYVMADQKKTEGRGLRRGFTCHFYEYDPDHKGTKVALCGTLLDRPNDIDKAHEVFNRTGGRIKTTDCGICYTKKRAALVARKKENGDVLEEI